MKKAFKPITHVDQLIGGQLYIRACINCHGATWLDVFRIMGKSFKTKEIWLGSTLLTKIPETKITVKGVESFSKLELRFPPSAGIHAKRCPDDGLYPYSNALYNHLKPLLNNRRKLMEFNFGGPLTDKKVEGLVQGWEFLIWCDNSSESQHDGYQPTIINPFLDDESVNGFMLPTLTSKEQHEESF